MTETAETPLELVEPVEAESGIRIGEKIYASPEDFTIGEAEIIKQNTNLSPQELIMGVQEDPTDPLYLRAIAWTVLHRENAKVEWDDDLITQSYIGAFFEIPEEAAKSANPPGSRRRKSS